MEEKKYITILKTGNKSPFTLPENYFDDFAGKMDELIAATPQDVKRFRLRPWMYGVAASLIGIVFLGQVYLYENKNDNYAYEAYETYVLSQVNESSIIDYYLTSDTENR